MRRWLLAGWWITGILVWSVLTAPAGAVSGPSAGPDVPPGAVYRPPVQRAVADPFREPAGPYGPGNRGLEYATAPGDVVVGIGAGVVVFAGRVAGRGVVSVVHPDGLRSTYTGLEVVLVTEGDPVGVGAPLGTAAGHLHLGVRRGRRYLDPANLFVGRAPPRHAVLVPATVVQAALVPR